MSDSQHRKQGSLEHFALPGSQKELRLPLDESEDEDALEELSTEGAI
jgi:hypothetical protein